MSHVIIRPARVIVAALAAALLLAGCGGPSRVGAAAIVGDQRIPVSQVESWSTVTMNEQPTLKEKLREQGQLGELGRRLAGFAVRQQLVRRVAEKEQLSVDEQQVTARIKAQGGVRRATEGTILNSRNFRASVRSRLLLAELGRKYVDRLSITIDYTQATSRADAQRKAQRMARGPREAAELIAADRAAGTATGTGKRMQAMENPRMALNTPLFGAEPGTVLAFRGSKQRSAGQWMIALVRERATTSQASAETGQLGDRAMLAFGRRLLGLTAQRADVRLSPRYGAWDPIQLTAVPEEGQTTGFRIGGHALST
ncbi:ABC-type uncharacterized transport system auxiliary subunit [Saccharopolyspora lacisalsi]|uniref:ABC-type uncharacterized transport system auxiliary subunit n=1 Tax=Halosaccharopolyspora lacisalsi TaxID=1000566 RepID=A0A839DRB5_9PSEU|nr:hypothetical protein [Halosaccharopolyspora lacisalsi]MBA8822826.1 ABC-type uncharacterized transport system auxiliary subunit [Halosaccharopolyspora lacisalsi]